MYQLFKPLLFLFTPEKAHWLATRMLRIGLKVPGLKQLISSSFRLEDRRLERQVLGIKFKNPVGLAAGFDKNAELIDDFAHLGFGHIEIGTVTPKAQPGNEKPRLFRLKSDHALINRMGFNNKGVDQAVRRLKKRKSNLIIGGNIGKNKVTHNDQALDDYLICFNSLVNYVDYFVVNVSSPNTPGLRELQEKEPLKNLLSGLLDERTKLQANKPILLKIAPDLTDPQVDDVLEIVDELNLDGLVVSNTTIERGGLSSSEQRLEQIGAGGLSGAPVFQKSTELLRYIRTKNANVPIIAVGGISSPEQALEKLDAGADLIQIYTGLIYEGPGLIKRINKALLKRLN